METRTDGAASCRTITVTQHCPPAMRKRDVWRVDHFHLLRKVGSGYASTVYLGTCRTTGNQVAVKLYHKNKLSELNQFQVAREITIHSGLDHKHIIQLWAAFEDQYGIYLVFEYASKGDVFTEVERRGGQLNEAESVRQVIFPFLSALDYLHSNYIIHRDIKPENLLFTATGVLKVGDFGLSINFSQERPVTRVGTLDYMAPEVVVCPDKHRPQDHKELKHLHYTPLVDAWAVGVLAYELIMGRPPFDKGQKKATINEILNGEPFIPPWLSEGAAHFIRWALTKEQGKRPSVRQLSEHPWIVGHMKHSVLNSARRQLVKTDSFVEPRQLGFRGSTTPADSPMASSNSKEPPRPLQVTSVIQNGRTLGHSNSMSAVDGMRYRDVNLDSVTGGMANTAEAALKAVKRLSDGDGTTGGRPSAAGGRVSRAGAARSSGAGGLHRNNSIGPAAVVVAAAAVGAEDSPKSGRLTPREELPASPGSNRNMNLVRSFTAGRSSPNLQHSSVAQPVMRMSGGGVSAGGVAGSVSRSHSMSPGSLLARGSVHDQHHSHPDVTSAHGSDVASDMSRMRVDSSHSHSAGGTPGSPRLSSTPIRPQPPQVPSPSARGLKTGSPLIPSRLSQSFTSPVSPLASAGSAPHPAPSRLGQPSNSGASHICAATSTRQMHPLDMSACANGGNSSMGMSSPRLHSASMCSPRAAGGPLSQMSSMASLSPRGSPRELPGDADDMEERPSGGSKGKGLFTSIKKVFS